MTAEGNDWFAFTWQGADGAGHRTGNLRRKRDGWLFAGNSWYDENPERLQIPVVRASPRGGRYNRAQQVTLEGSNDDDCFFYARGWYGTHDRIPALCRTHSRRSDDDALGNRSQQRRRAGSDTHLHLHHRPEHRSGRPAITSSHDGGTYADPIDAVFTVRDNRPAPITAYLTLDGSEPDLSVPAYVVRKRRGRIGRPGDTYHRYHQGAVPGGGWCRQPDPAQLLLQHRSQGSPRRFPRGDHLFPHHHPFL